MISKAQTFEILSLIREFYEQFEITQKKIDSWHLILKDYEFEIIKDNLLKHCKTNKFVPKIADLIQHKEITLDRMNAIPNVEETQKYLLSINNSSISCEDEHLINQSKAEIRKILGIG